MRLKDVTTMNALTLPETTSSDYAFQYIDIGSVDGDGNISLGEQIQFDGAPSRARRIVKRNDVLISTVRTYLKAIAPVNFDAVDVIASTGFAVCTPKHGTHPSYLAYAVRSDDVINEICKESSGISYPAINSTMLSAIEIPYCDEKTQRRIVSYLDEKTAAIDERVVVLEKKLAAYKRLETSVINRAVTRGLDPNAKLKDSGVDWIGKVPAGWSVGRVKDVALIGNGSDPQTEGDIPVYGSGDGAFKTCGEFKVGPVVLIGRKGATLHIPHYIEGKYWNVDTAFDVRMVRANDIRWFYYQAIRFEYRYYTSQTTLPSMTQSDYQNMVIGIPLPTEQRAIADYLDAECVKIDKMAALVTREIELYKKLKRSLINEVVTGKRPVFADEPLPSSPAGSAETSRRGKEVA